MEMAELEGIRVPKTGVIGNRDDLKGWIIRNGFPAVLKANGTSGGDGVRVVRTTDDAARAFRLLQSPPRFLRAAKHALLDDDLTLISPTLRREKFVVNAQAFVDGREATSAVACWNGRVLAALHFEVIRKTSPTGHATVVRSIENPEMAAAAEKIVQRLHLSGVHGFDFMLENMERVMLTLIEVTPTSDSGSGHLALGVGAGHSGSFVRLLFLAIRCSRRRKLQRKKRSRCSRKNGYEIPRARCCGLPTTMFPGKNRNWFRIASTTGAYRAPGTPGLSGNRLVLRFRRPIR